MISSIVCEGLRDAAGACRTWRARPARKRLDVMPPHHWLRFGFRPGHVIEYFDAIAEVGLDLVAHVYPAWTRASYSSATLAQLARLPYVQAFKVGQRDMNKLCQRHQGDPRRRPVEGRSSRATTSTCWRRMVQGIDGALVGFATFIPGLINDLWEAVKAGDLKRAMKIQDLITPLKDAVYGGGEPTGEAHARMKAGMYLAGVIDDPTRASTDRAAHRRRDGRAARRAAQRRPAEALTRLEYQGDNTMQRRHFICTAGSRGTGCCQRRDDGAGRTRASRSP